MAKIYRTTDRIEIKIGETVVKIAPLGYQAKQMISQKMVNAQKVGDLTGINDAVTLAMRHCVKSISGLTDMNDEPYQLEFENQILSDKCTEELLNMEYTSELLKVATQFINGVPKVLDIKGVEFVEKKTPEAISSQP